jgi:hypothetical protein
MLSRFGWKTPYNNPLFWIGFIGLIIGLEMAWDGPLSPETALIVMLVSLGLIYIADYRLNKGHPALGSPAYWGSLICEVIGLVVWSLQGYGPKAVGLIMLGLGYVIWYLGLRHSNKTG